MTPRYSVATFAAVVTPLGGIVTTGWVYDEAALLTAAAARGQQVFVCEVCMN